MCDEVYDLSMLLRRLGSKWGITVLSTGGGSNKWSCCDHTDEGIGGELTFLGNTPYKAVIKAYEYVFNGRGAPD